VVAARRALPGRGPSAMMLPPSRTTRRARLLGKSQIANRKSQILIGTRASKLALTQSQWAAERLAAAHPGLGCELVRITTSGDREPSQPLPRIGGKGLFTRELEDALLGGEIDLAVHSLKDLPTQLPDGLVVASVPPRAPASDALILSPGLTSPGSGHAARGTRRASSLELLPQRARIGTSSPRRAAQLRLARPDLRCEPIRGNLDTRLRKLAEGQFDAIVLALAGLARLGLADRATEVLPFEVMLPAPGQGALAIEARAGSEAAALAAAIADEAATLATTAERALLDALGGGCSMPLGAYAELSGGSLRLRAVLFAPDGSLLARADETGPAGEPAALAHRVARALR